jgi:large subunit ribosomal protein L3
MRPKPLFGRILLVIKELALQDLKMAIGLIGRKAGMTRIFGADGAAVPVTVIEVAPNKVTQVKTPDHDGYSALQVTRGKRRATRVSKALAGHFAKAGVEAGDGLWEFRLADGEGSGIAVGAELKVDLFKDVKVVDVSGVSKGKGFAGVVKRHHFAMQDATHGNSRSHRVPGSTGQRQSPGRVFPGKKMPGHMGDDCVTTQNLELVKVDAERNLLLVKGAVPGAAGGTVIVQPAIKNRK